MSANTKWETVKAADLNVGDRVRILHDNGDVINGTWDDKYGTPSLWAHTADGSWGESYEDKGYRFERAVPERTLPTEPGWYFSASSNQSFRLVGYRRGEIFRWVHEEGDFVDSDDEMPADLVRLVPVTEADELRKRIEKVRERIAMLGGTYIGSLALDILAILDGEATDV